MSSSSIAAGMIRYAARQQVKVFTADNQNSLENELNAFLLDLQADRVIDIKYSAEMLEVGQVWFYSAMVIYEMHLQSESQNK
ncbi:sporulation protein Cse60 (plasmid) [Alicyclobacillus curvatus]|nr:sporulation protein Cse60 [Alicyclobacillus curvatus]